MMMLSSLLQITASIADAVGSDGSSGVSQYEWIVVVGALFALFAAFGIGANDVANAFATSVGSKALSIKHAVMLAAVFEFSGAVLMGSHVTKTIRKGIADTDCFESNPGLLMYGMMCVIFSVGVWLLLASYWELPVSTTHSAVGGVVGMTLAIAGSGCVIWHEPIDQFPYTKGVSAIVISWILSPILSGIISAAAFASLRFFVLRRANVVQLSYLVLPLVVFATLSVNIFFIIYKGAKGLDLELSLNESLAWAFGVAGGTTLLVSPFLIPFLKRRVATSVAAKKEMEAEQANARQVKEKAKALMMSGSGSDEENGESGAASIELAAVSVNVDNAGAMAAGTKADADADTGSGTPPLKPSPTEMDGLIVVVNDHDAPTKQQSTTDAADTKVSLWKRLASHMDYSLNEDPHNSINDVAVGGVVSGIHDTAETFDHAAEECFKHLQIFTAIFDSFSHGANDVANSIGPFAAIYFIFREGAVTSSAELGNDMYWILALGGFGIVLGLALYGYKIMRALGVKMAAITPARGFVIELSAAIVILIGARQGWPLSTTHCQVGATVGVALLEGSGGVNWRLLGKTGVGWIVTLLVTGSTTALLASWGAYTPSK